MAGLDDYTEPECQFTDCEAAAEETVEHDRHGTIRVCETCANLWGESDE